MTNQEKKDKIRSLVVEMLGDSKQAMMEKLDTVLKSGCIDADNWDENINPMILPQTIITALLEKESLQRNGSGTSYEKEIKKNVRRIRCFI
jgi:hypothetical protein